MTSPQREPGAELGTGAVDEGMAIAVSPHTLASQAAIEVIRNGGNAIDGAVALNAVLGVVLPDTCGPGGDLFALVHIPGMERPVTLNSSGRAGSNVDAAALREQGLSTIPMQSAHTITVPGCVDGWEALLTRLGTVTLADALRPAIDIAENGFPASPELAASLTRYHDRIGDQPSAGELFPGGTPPQPGTVVRRPSLGRTLSALAAGGRAAFYGGEVGRAITAVTEGAITADDLATVQADWIEPLGLDLFGRTAWTIPPNSQGYLTLAGLWLFEQLGPPEDPEDPRYHHALIEAYRAVAWERPELVADPATAPLPPDELLSPARLGSRLAAIDPNRAAVWPAPTPAPGGTAYMCVRDGTGMAISLIQSNYWGIGTGLSAGSTGVWLHNRGGGFDLRAGHPNELYPGRRPMHTLSPTMWTRDGRLDLVLGTRGGDQQPQLLMQFAAHHYHGGAAVEAAQQLPRWTITGIEAGTPSVVNVESRFDAALLDGLARRGHQVTAVDAWMAGWGPISAIDTAAAPCGAADPRVTTSAAVAG